MMALFLCGCTALGSLSYDGVTETSVRPDDSKLSAYAGYLRVELSSTVDIAQYLHRSGREVLYVHARLCPVPGKQDVTVIAFGPYERSGGGKYDIYIVPQHPQPSLRYSKTFLAEHRPYDLKMAGQDVCVRFSAPGYPAATWSEELRIPASVLSRNANAQ